MNVTKRNNALEKDGFRSIYRGHSRTLSSGGFESLSHRGRYVYAACMLPEALEGGIQPYEQDGNLLWEIETTTHAFAFSRPVGLGNTPSPPND